MTLVVKGERELVRAFNLAAPEMRRRFRASLRDIARPVKDEAERLARDDISGLARSKKRWWKMRIGVSTNLVYVAPVQRGLKGRGDLPGRRPNFADLMLDKAMEPALADHEGQIFDDYVAVVDSVTGFWEAV